MVKQVLKLSILAVLLTALFLFLTWIRTMNLFVTGLNPAAPILKALLCVAILVPIVVGISKYLKVKISYTPAELFVMGAMILLMGASFKEFSALQLQPKDHQWLPYTIFFCLVAAVYHFYPRVTGKPMNSRLGHIHFWVTLIMVWLICFPVIYTGPAGMPRRYIYIDDGTPHIEYRVPLEGIPFYDFDRRMIVLIAAQFLFLVNIAQSKSAPLPSDPNNETAR